MNTMKNLKAVTDDIHFNTEMLLDEVDRIDDLIDSVQSELKDLIYDLNVMIQDRSEVDTKELYLRVVKIYEILM